MNDEGLAEFEMVQMGNLSPETADEARTLVPSLQGKKDEDGLQRLVDDLASAQRFQS